MIARARKYLSSDLLRVSSLNALATIVRMLTGLVSVKYVATLIGPSGIAILGQLNNFTTITQTIASAGINQGITRYVAERKKEQEQSTQYIATGFWITLVSSFISGLVIFLLAERLSLHFLKNAEFSVVFRIYAATLLFFSMNALLLSVVNGMKDFRNFFFINVAGSIVGLAFTVILTHFYELRGTLIATVTFQSVVFLVTIAMLRNREWFRPANFVRQLYRSSKATELLKFSSMTLLSAFLVPLAQLIIRENIIKLSSLNDAGLWEGVNRISNIYLMIAITSLSVYFLPRLAELQERDALRTELKSVYKLMIPGLAICGFLIFIFRNLLITLLFSREFSGMADIIHFQLAGDVIKMAGWVLGYLMLAKVMIKPYIILEIVSFLAQVLFSYVLVREYGALGATMGYACAHLLYLLSAILILRKLLFA